jgi:hypothetical protein
MQLLKSHMDYMERMKNLSNAERPGDITLAPKPRANVHLPVLRHLPTADDTITPVATPSEVLPAQPLADPVHTPSVDMSLDAELRTQEYKTSVASEPPTELTLHSQGLCVNLLHTWTMR